ncbi:hypothetical protein [Streptosporangium sp. NPDC003464]
MRAPIQPGITDDLQCLVCGPKRDAQTVECGLAGRQVVALDVDVEPAPGRYRVRLTDDADGPGTVLTVPVPTTDDVLFRMFDGFR